MKPGFAAPLINATVAATSYLPTSDLPEGRIFWRVASLDAAVNQSAFSASLVLYVRPDTTACGSGSLRQVGQSRYSSHLGYAAGGGD